MRVLTWATAAALLAAVSDASAGNALLNSGFESGSFSGWTVGGNSINTGVGLDGTLITGDDTPFTPSRVNVRSGSFAGYALVQNGSDPVERIILSQTISVLANEVVSVGFWLGIDAGSAFGMTIDDAHTQIFVDGVGILPSSFTSINNGSSSSAFSLISGSFNTGSSTSVTISYAINGSGTSRAGASFDDFFAETDAIQGPAVPEPASLALMGLGGLGLLGSRCRRRAAA